MRTKQTTANLSLPDRGGAGVLRVAVRRVGRRQAVRGGRAGRRVCDGVHRMHLRVHGLGHALWLAGQPAGGYWWLGTTWTIIVGGLSHAFLVSGFFSNSSLQRRLRKLR